MLLLEGRRGLVVGVANERSLAYGIAQAARDQGARLSLSYQADRLRRRVEPLAVELGAEILTACDLRDDAQVKALAEKIATDWGGLDFLVHAVAWADQAELGGRFLDTSRGGFAQAMDVSAYSLLALVRPLEPLLAASPHGGSVLTITYLGSEKAMPGYNVMGVAKAALEAAVRYLAVDLGPRGIRINALSAGPIRTLSAAAVSGLRAMLAHTRNSAPLGRNVTLDDVGQAALFSLSDLGRGMTGEVFHVDAGYHAVGVPGSLARQQEAGGDESWQRSRS